MQYMMKRLGLQDQMTSISTMRGRVFNAALASGPLKLVPMYHPAVAIYSRSSLPVLKADMEVLKSLL